MKKGVDERIEEGFLLWFGHVERMENDRIPKRAYVRKYDGSRLVWVGRGRDGLMS